MLILARREGEVLRLTYQDIIIDVMVTNIRGGEVKIGIDAPRVIGVMREEILTPSGLEEST